MPIYDYKCSNCGHIEELIHSIREPMVKHCPACDGPTLVRVITGGGGFRLKGEGWYETDYKASPKRNLHDSG